MFIRDYFFPKICQNARITRLISNENNIFGIFVVPLEESSFISRNSHLNSIF